MTRSNVPLLVKQPSSLAGNNGLYLSRSVSTKQSGWLMQERACMYSVQSSPRYHAAAVTSDLKQRLIDTWASVSQNVIDEAVGQRKKRLCASTRQKDITLNIC